MPQTSAPSAVQQRRELLDDARKAAAHANPNREPVRSTSDLFSLCGQRFASMRGLVGCGPRCCLGLAALFLAGLGSLGRAQAPVLDAEAALGSTFPLWQPVSEMRELATLFRTGAVAHDTEAAQLSNFSSFDEPLRELMYGIMRVQTEVVAWCVARADRHALHAAAKGMPANAAHAMQPQGTPRRSACCLLAWLSSAAPSPLVSLLPVKHTRLGWAVALRTARPCSGTAPT